MFLIGAIKHNKEKKFKICFIFFMEVSFVSYRVMFSGGNKRFIENKPEKIFIMLKMPFYSLT